MGERIGWSAISGKDRSPIVRQQWMDDPYDVISDVVKHLLAGKKVGDGCCAYRSDLDETRAFNALVHALGTHWGHEVHMHSNCDIDDHGLIEIDVTDWKNWIIYRYPVEWNDGSAKVPDVRDDQTQRQEIGSVVLGKVYIEDIDECDCEGEDLADD